MTLSPVQSFPKWKVIPPTGSPFLHRPTDCPRFQKTLLINLHTSYKSTISALHVVSKRQHPSQKNGLMLLCLAVLLQVPSDVKGWNSSGIFSPAIFRSETDSSSTRGFPNKVTGLGFSPFFPLTLDSLEQSALSYGMVCFQVDEDTASWRFGFIREGVW